MNQKHFRTLVKETIPHITDEDMDVFFETDYEIVIIKKGYIGISHIDGRMFIAFLYKGNDFGTIRAVYRYLKGKEVLYALNPEDSNKDHYNNNSTHSEEDEDDVMRLMI